MRAISVTKREARVIASVLEKSGEDVMSKQFTVLADASEAEMRKQVNKIRTDYKHQNQQFKGMIEKCKTKIQELQSEVKELGKASSDMDRMNKAFEGLKDKSPETILKSPRTKKFVDFLENAYIEY